MYRLQRSGYESDPHPTANSAVQTKVKNLFSFEVSPFTLTETDGSILRVIHTATVLNKNAFQ